MGTKFRFRRQFTAVTLLILVMQEFCLAEAESSLGYDLQKGLNMYAKVTCSAVFVSGREATEALYNSGYVFLPPLRNAENRVSGNLRNRLDFFEIDSQTGTVELRRNSGETATARFFGDQGCVVGPHPDFELQYRPIAVESSLPPSDTMDWPMGDRVSSKDPLAPDARQQIESALDLAFSPGLLTHSFLVVHKGRIVAERYDQGIDEHTQTEAWSMGKSLTALLFGVLVFKEGIGLDKPARIDDVRDDDDPRSEITHRHLLNMASGPRFSSLGDNAAAWEQGVPDHHYVYTGVTDAFDYVVNRPLEMEPNTVGRYRNSDPLAIGAIIRRTVEERGENYWQWPQEALFDKVGIRRQVLETDLVGNFLLTVYDYGTARNWARLRKKFTPNCRRNRLLLRRSVRCTEAS